MLGRARAAWAGYPGIDGGLRPGLVNLGVNWCLAMCTSIGSTGLI